LIVWGCEASRRMMVQQIPELPEHDETYAPEMEALEIPTQGDIQEMLIRGMYRPVLQHFEEKKPVSAVEYWQLAYAAYKIGEYQSALRAIDALENENTILDQYENYLRALVYYDKKEYKDGAEALTPLSQFSRPLLSEVYRLKYRCYFVDEKYDEALSLLGEYRQQMPGEISYSEYKYELAKIDLETGLKTKAYDAFLGLMEASPGSYWAERSAIKLKEKSNLDATELYYLGLVFSERKKWPEAVQYLTTYLNDPEHQKYRYKATLCRANSYYESGNFNQAIKEFNGMMANQEFPEGLYRLGRCYHKLGNTPEALTCYRKVADNYPSSDWAAWSLWWLVEAFRADRDWDAARKTCDRIFASFKSHELTDNAILWAGISAFLNGDYEISIDRFQTILDRADLFKSENFQASAAAWIAICKQMKGDPSAVENFVEISGSIDKTYYHFVSDKYLGVVFPDPAKPNSDTLIYNQYEASLLAQSSLLEQGYPGKILSINSSGFQRAIMLARIGLLKWAENEVNEWEKDFDNDPQTILELSRFYTDLGLTNKAYKTADHLNNLIKSSKKPSSPALLRLKYPVFYFEEIGQACLEYRIDPLLVLALMRRESGFDPQAVSYAEAIGLLQIIPSTGKTIAQNLGENYSDAKLYDYKTNIRYGVWYLRYLLDKFDNQIEYALAAYNAGEKQLPRWIAIPHSPQNIELFIENIDFQQTRHYVRNVLEDYYNYVRLWRSLN
ncbi:transglycosylase SLT domain-containing protein, partial [bacterium]|nr:transglycosylase SLT domain-containing protein [bacterium]